MDQLKTYIRASYPIIQIVTNEEGRAIKEIKRVATVGLATSKRPLGYKLWSWSISAGLRDSLNVPIRFNVRNAPALVETGKTYTEPEVTRQDYDLTGRSKDPVAALQMILDGEITECAVIVMADFHLFLKSGNPMIIRLLKEFAAMGRVKHVHIVIVGCERHCPPELEKELPSIDLPLPDREELRAVLNGVIEGAKKLPAMSEEQIVAASTAALGLTTHEASAAFAFSVAKHKAINTGTIASIKTDTVRRNGIVDIVDTKMDSSEVGGLASVKSWIVKRVNAFSDKAKEFGVPTPKGVMVIGISGTGKSLVAKTIANTLNVPMLRLEGSKIYNQYVGESERNMRTALHVADIMSPCVLFIDEIEKALAGAASGGKLDSGVSSRIVGTLLQWMQDRKSQVFVVATANDVSQLPPETLRRGRFDQIFFVDIPDDADREDIWRIHIKRIKRNPKDFDIPSLSELTDGYTGAEIASVVDDGLINAFDQQCEPTTEIMAAAVLETVPLSRTMREKIQGMRQWASARAMSASGKPIVMPVVG